MSPLRNIGIGAVALCTFALVGEPDASALSCAGPPIREALFLEIEQVTEDGVQVMDADYIPYTVLLEGTDFDEHLRLWVMNDEGRSWWQDFE